MTAYSPPEYQKRAAAREHHAKEVAELTEFATWLIYNAASDINDLTTGNLEAFAECFIRAKEASSHV